MNNKDLIEETYSIANDYIDIIGEIITDEQIAQSRWNTRINTFFSALSRLVSHFFVSRIKDNEINSIQKYTRYYFRKSDCIEKIEKNSELQKIFVSGYCHAIDKLVTDYENAISYKTDETFSSIIHSYKNLTPILLALEKNVQMNHKSLANEVGISEPALSNLIKKTEKYKLFSSVRIGKNRYYAIAHPNGEEALKILKEDSIPSADSYSDYLILLFDSLLNISKYQKQNNNYIEKCNQIFFEHYTKPYLLKKKFADIVDALQCERFYYNSLLSVERTVEKNVTIFTKNIKSEAPFRAIIRDNIEKEVYYNYFFSATSDVDTVEKARRLFYADLYPDCNHYNCFNKYVHFHIIKDYFIEGSDIVIYDGEKGYGCTDEDITEHSIYTRLSTERMNELLSWAKEKESLQFFE